MKIGKALTRLRLSLVTCAVLLGSGAFLVAGAAAAESPPADASGLAPNYIGQNAFNPQESNVPYLAWRGEEVRLVKCTHELDSGPAGPATLETNGGVFWNNLVSIQVFAYSGPQENSFDGPKPVTGSASIFFDEHNDRWCVRSTWISNKPGIVIFKLSVQVHGVQLAVHDFMVGWMAINSATMTNAGTVTDVPGQLPGNSVNVQVKGSIPLNSEFQADYGLPAQLIMPDDWALWAKAMATTDQNLSGTNSQPPASAFWDIHDSSGPLGVTDSADVHTVKGTSEGVCPADSTLSNFVDQVDNCTGNGEDFSRLFGDLTNGENGPFDPSFASTLLSDGRLNANDAPMPALKIVFNSAGGMGGFDNSCLNDKDNVYNSNFGTNLVYDAGAEDGFAPWSCIKGTKDDQEVSAHSLYAPYYETYIPATARDYWGSASGIDGPVINGQPNNFQGFGWNSTDPYPYWAIAQELVSNKSQPTKCLLTTNQQPIFRKTNGFPTSVVEFTDEHGEARAQWQPGVNSDLFANPALVNEQGGCDLTGVALGPQTITAAARYPFQPVANDFPVTGTITKNISNLFNKNVHCVLKSNGIEYRCTASATDITGGGEVFNGEQVCFVREPANIWIDTDGSIQENGFCKPLSGGTDTDPATATADTPATIPGQVINVFVWFQGEKLGRSTCIVTGQPASGACGGVGGTSTTSGTTSGTGTTSGSSTGGGLGNTTIKIHTPSSHNTKAYVASVQLVLTRNGRVLMVRVNSKTKTARISIRLIDAKGHLIKVVVRTVKTNKRVAVPNLRISKQVRSVRVQTIS